MTARSNDYEERRKVNEESRNKAEHHEQPWAEEEVVFLEENWSNDEEDLIALAELLGRTVEACRQKHYTIGKRMIERARRAENALDRWTRGFTSIEEMERYYGEME